MTTHVDHIPEISLEKVAVVPKLPTFAVIVVTDDTENSDLVWYLDTNDDGDYYPAFNFPKKLIFGNIAKARAKLTEILNRAEEKVTSSNGVRRPLPDISSLLGLSNTKKFSSITLTAMSITLVPVSTSVQITGKIEEPTGFTYD